MLLKYQNEEIIKSRFNKQVKKDAKDLLVLCGLNPDLDVWKIQIEE